MDRKPSFLREVSEREVLLDRKASFLRRVVRSGDPIGQEAVISAERCPKGRSYWTGRHRFCGEVSEVAVPLDRKPSFLRRGVRSGGPIGQEAVISAERCLKWRSHWTGSHRFSGEVSEVAIPSDRKPSFLRRVVRSGGPIGQEAIIFAERCPKWRSHRTGSRH